MPPKRITFFALGLLLVMGAFAAGGVATWKKRNFWVGQLRTLHAESLELASESKGAFEELNGELLHFEVTRHPNDRKQFEGHAHKFGLWLAARAQDATLPEIQSILKQLISEYARYREHASAFIASLPPVHAVFPADELLAQIDED